MSAQNNPGRQYDKQHAVTIVATAAVLANRFIAYDGAYATDAGGAHDMQGVSESDAARGQALAVITGYSALVEAAGALDFGEYVQPAADGSGRAAAGDIGDHCARALGNATAAGELVEVQLVTHIHA